jgi:acetyl-CoA carboxylase carboxyl transferase subunit beta
MEKLNLKTQCVLELESKGKELVICCMDFAFIGGSMGAVVGERNQEESIIQSKNNIPL